MIPSDAAPRYRHDDDSRIKEKTPGREGSIAGTPTGDANTNAHKTVSNSGAYPYAG
jgi:hypothetical protein